MGRTSYSTQAQPTVAQILDTAIDPVTLNTGDGLVYDATDQLWKNQPGGGGGGSTITGTNDAVVFKNGTNGDADNTGITRLPTGFGYTVNLDTANKRVGVNKQSPAYTLDVGGDTRITSGSNIFGLTSSGIGNLSPSNSLFFYSHNTPAPSNALFIMDSQNKIFQGAGLRTYNPTAPDSVLPIDKNSFYKVRLSRGMDKEPGGVLFNTQEDYNNILGFPTGQMTEYQNQMNINKPIIIGRVATGASVPVAGVYAISSFGGTTSFQDRLFYDPMQMRSRKVATTWVFAGAPTVYRVSGTKLGWNIKWYFEGQWASSNSNNRLHMYCNQFRNGALFKTFLVGISNNADDCFMSGERTFLSWSSSFNEDFDVLTDDWLVEVANQGQHDIIVNLAQVELSCWLAQ